MMQPPYPQSRRPSVMFLCTSYQVGGMQRVVAGVSRELAHSGWDVQTLFPQPQEAAERERLLRWCAEQGVKADTSPYVMDAFFKHSWHEVAGLRRMLQTSGADIVNFHYGDNFISLKDMLGAFRAGPRVIATVHHPTPWNKGNQRKRALTLLGGLLADRVTTFSQATYRVLRQAGIPKAKIDIIPCGAAIPRHTPARQEARERMGLPQDRTIVGCLSRLVPHKNVDQLIEAVAKLPATDPEVLLVVAGDGECRADLEALGAERLGERVRFLGYVPDVDDFYAACDVFALPSELEGFGLVYVEAAFHGVPSVGTLAGGVPEAVDDGKTGLLIKVGDKSALVDALWRFCNDPGLRQRMGEAGRKRAYAELTERAMAERFDGVFRRNVPQVGRNLRVEQP